MINPHQSLSKTLIRKSPGYRQLMRLHLSAAAVTDAIEVDTISQAADRVGGLSAVQRLLHQSDAGHIV